MIGQGFYHAARPGSAALAGRGDAGKFALQCAQLEDTRIDVIEVALGDAIGFTAWPLWMVGQIEQ